MASVMTRYGRKVFPFVLIYLGLSIMVKSGTYQLVPNLTFHGIWKTSLQTSLLQGERL
jgi:hypothetical protein